MFGKRYDVFLSYSRADSDRVTPLTRRVAPTRLWCLLRRAIHRPQLAVEKAVAPDHPGLALGKRWAAFLSNHREAIAAMDFFTVPTLTFGVLYCFFVVAHSRRRILPCNVTKHPGSAWIIQQLREAFPYDSAPDYLIFDRGSNFNKEVIDTLKTFGIHHPGGPRLDLL